MKIHWNTIFVHCVNFYFISKQSFSDLKKMNFFEVSTSFNANNWLYFCRDIVSADSVELDAHESLVFRQVLDETTPDPSTVPPTDPPTDAPTDGGSMLIASTLLTLSLVITNVLRINIY